MNKQLIVCGDSFSIGIGCHDLINEPYGSLLSKELDKPLLNFAKGSSTNMSIYLQAKYVSENFAESADLVIVSNTSYDRVEWFPWDHKHPTGDLTNTDVNYHEYPPYGEHTYHVIDQQVMLENPMKDDSRYNGKLFTDNYMGVIDYWETYGKEDLNSGYYKRFINEPKARMKTLYDFATTIHDPIINRIYSIGVLTLAHQLLKRAGLKHLILTHEVNEYCKYIDEENLCNLSWGQLSIDYPDDLKTWHTSHYGHKAAATTIMQKLKENMWY